MCLFCQIRSHSDDVFKWTSVDIKLPNPNSSGKLSCISSNSVIFTDPADFMVQRTCSKTVWCKVFSYIFVFLFNTLKKASCTLLFILHYDWCKLILNKNRHYCFWQISRSMLAVRITKTSYLYTIFIFFHCKKW